MEASTIHIAEVFIDTTDGFIFAKIWKPQNAKKNETPIVLLQDSHESIAIWSNFPEELAKRTGRIIIAYDRPGYGYSSKDVEDSLAKLMDAFSLQDIFIQDQQLDETA